MALICEAAALVFAQVMPYPGKTAPTALFSSVASVELFFESPTFQLTLTSYLTLSESGLSDADESMAWLLPFTYPSPDDVVQVCFLLQCKLCRHQLYIPLH